MDIQNHEKGVVWAQIIYLYIIPVLLLYYGVIPEDFRFIMLFSIAFLMFGIIRHSHWTYEDMGIYKYFWKDMLPYTIFTIGGASFLFWLSQITLQIPMLDWRDNLQFLILFAPVSILQEVVFRGVLMNFLKKVFTNPIFIILLNAIIFAIMHVIYVNATFVLPLTFMAGAGFAWMYLKYPNLILISISHTILNFVAMILGFFAIR